MGGMGGWEMECLQRYATLDKVYKLCLLSQRCIKQTTAVPCRT